MCVRVSSTERPCSAKMSATSWRWIFQITKRSGSTVSMPSGPGGSASDADTSAALRAASRAIRSAACAGSGIGADARRGTSAITRSMRPDASSAGVRYGGGEGHSGHRREVGSRVDAPRQRRQHEIIRSGDRDVDRASAGRDRYNAASGDRRNGGSAVSMRIFGFAGWSGSGKTTLIEQIIPTARPEGPHGLARQARASSRGIRPAGQGFLSAPPRRLQRGAGDVGRALGADARAAGRARARAPAGARAAFALRSRARLKATRPTPFRSSKSGAPRSGKPLLHPRGSPRFSASQPTARTRCRQGPSIACRCSRCPILMPSQHSSPPTLPPVRSAIDFKWRGE